MRDCLIVVGMHRSGTSALAGAVHRLGVDFGQDLLEAQDDNVRGYYEQRGILELHEGLLADRGSGWDDPAPRDWELDGGRQSTAAFRDALSALLTRDFADSGLWAVKDPRLSHLLPAWLPVLEALGARPHVLVAVRDPSEVAASLARRDGFSCEKSALLWLQHNLAAERASRPFPRAFVDFAELLKDPGSMLTRAGRQLGLRWPVEPAAAGAELGTFLDAGLRHQKAAAGAPSTEWGRVGDLVPALVEALRSAAADPAGPEAFDEIASRLTGSVDVDPLVLEHVHQFGRRELRREMWSAKQSLEEGLRSTSERLGGGLQETERHWKALASRLASIEKEIEQRRRAAQESTAEVDRTLGHLTQALAAAESSLGHLQSEDGDLRARLDRGRGRVEAADQPGGQGRPLG